MKRFLLMFWIGIGIIPLTFANPISNLNSIAGLIKKFPGAEYVTLFDSTRVRMMESGLSYYQEHQMVMILTPGGGKHFNVFNADYDPLTASVEIRRIIVYYKNGIKKELNQNNEVDFPAPAGTILWGSRQKMTEIGRLEPGDSFEVFVSKKGFAYALLDAQNEDDKYIPPMRGHFYDIVPFWSDAPLLVKVYQVAIPNSKVVNYQVYNGKLNIRKEKGIENSIYSFSLSDIKPFASEPNMVALSDVAPKLLISTAPDWQSKSKWFFSVNEDYGSFKSTPDIDQKVKEILKGSVSEQDSISKLTHWVADELRYLGLSMGKGEGYTLHRGSMDFLDRCGVCKDKAGMLITMLRSAGFKAYPSMTMAGSRIDRIPADQFNHSVVVVKLSDRKLHLLDPTWVPFVRELWSSAEQQQNYLPGIPEGSDLLETPVSSPKNHFVKISASSQLTKEGTLTGEISVTAEGQSDASLRRMFTGSFKANWKNNLENELLRIAPQAKILKSTYGDDPYNYMAGPIDLRISYEIPDYATVTESAILFTPLAGSGIFSGAMRNLFIDVKADTRHFPFRDACSRSIEINDKTTIPSGYKLSWTPKVEKSAGSGASFEASYTLEGTQFRLNEKAEYYKRIYTPEDWPSFRDAVKMQKTISENPVILTL